MNFRVFMCYRGAWLSWLERTVHIREVVGSSPSAPTSVKPPIRVVFHIYWSCPGTNCRDLRGEEDTASRFASPSDLCEYWSDFLQRPRPKDYLRVLEWFSAGTSVKPPIRVVFHIPRSCPGNNCLDSHSRSCGISIFHYD